MKSFWLSLTSISATFAFALSLSAQTPSTSEGGAVGNQTVATETKQALSQSDTGSSPENSVVLPTKKVESFFKSLSDNQVDTAYEGLLKDTKIAEAIRDVATLKSKTREAISSLGPIRDWEMISSQRVGRRLASLVYLSYGTQLPLRWKFYYYNVNFTPGNEQISNWKLVDIRIDDRFIDLFDESSTAAKSTTKGNAAP
jgi:hypothetical protein